MTLRESFFVGNPVRFSLYRRNRSGYYGSNNCGTMAHLSFILPTTFFRTPIWTVRCGSPTRKRRTEC